jgi:hypothetical protein
LRTPPRAWDNVGLPALTVAAGNGKPNVSVRQWAAKRAYLD